MSDQVQTSAKPEAIKISDASGGKEFSRPAQFDNLLTTVSDKEPPVRSTAENFMPKEDDVFVKPVDGPKEDLKPSPVEKGKEGKVEGNKPNERAISLPTEAPPGVEQFNKLKATEKGDNWHEQFRKNQEGYRKGIGEADKHLAEKEKEYLDKFKPGEKGGLEEKEQKAIEEIQGKKTELETSVNKLDPEKRLEGLSMALAYASETDPQARLALKAAMESSGFGSLVKPADGLKDAMDKNDPVLQEAHTVRQGYLRAIDNSALLRLDYGLSLMEASRISPKPGDEAELTNLGKSTADLNKKSNKVNKPILLLDFKIDGPSPGIKI